MRKQWLSIYIAARMLATCSSDDSQQQGAVAPQPTVCNGPIVEISGADPRFEPLNPMANRDYQRDGKNYEIVQDPSHFSQTGLAAIYGAEPGSNLTASGGAFNPMQLTATHPALPAPSYARITNLANNRMIVVCINDRGPHGNDRVISLSRTTANRLNTPNNTGVRIDPIIVIRDSSLSGPGMAYTTVAKRTYALPARPDLSGGGSMGSMPTPSDVGQPQGGIRPINNSTLKSDGTTGTPVNNSGFLGAPATLATDAPENSEPTPAPQPTTTAPATPTAPAAAPAAVAAPAPAPATVANRCYMAWVGAVSERSRTRQYRKRLSQQFGIPDRVVQNDVVWCIQMGPFISKAGASTLQQRLQAEAQLRSFVTGV